MYSPFELISYIFFAAFVLVTLAAFVFIDLRFNEDELVLSLRTRKAVGAPPSSEQPSAPRPTRETWRPRFLLGIRDLRPQFHRLVAMFSERQLFDQLEKEPATQTKYEDAINEDSDEHESSDALDINQHHPKDDVEFLALAPKKVPPGQIFHIYVNIRKLPVDVYEEPDDQPSFQTIVAQVQRGSRVAAVLGPNRDDKPYLRSQKFLRIDAPYQALTWSGRDLIIDFRVHAPRLSFGRRTGRIESTLWITTGRYGLTMPRGIIDLKIEIDAGLTGVWGENENIPRQGDTLSQKEIQHHTKMATLSGIGQNAILFEKAFVCYAHLNKSVVHNFVRALEATYGQIYIDELDMRVGPHWLLQVAKEVKQSDIVFLFWSNAAAESPSVADEIEVIEQEIIRRKKVIEQEIIRGKKPTERELAVCIVPIEETKNKPPSSLIMPLPGYSKRNEFFEYF